MILSEVMNDICELRRVVNESTISDLLIALDIYTKTSLKKNTQAWTIRNHLVRDHLETVRDLFLADIHTPIIDVVRHAME